MDLVKEIEAAVAEAVNAIANTVAIMVEETMIVVPIAIGVDNKILEEVVDRKTCNMVLDAGMKKEVDTIKAETVAVMVMIGTRHMAVREVDMAKAIKDSVPIAIGIKETGVVNKADTVANKVAREDMAIKVTVTRAIGVSKVDMVNKVNMEIREDMAIRDTVIKVTGAVNKADTVPIIIGIRVAREEIEDLNLARVRMEI